MLNFLQIRNFTIVESLDLEFDDGFTCITGETGAGKSILVDALGLLCGNRADSGCVRAGTQKAELGAGFELPEDSPALDWLREAELDDGPSVLLRRVINEKGRSRAWINGTAVTLQQLAGLGALLVEMHGQNEHIRLVRSGEQFRLLDVGAGYDDELAGMRAAFDRWQALAAEKEALLEETPLNAGDLDLLRYQIRELEDNMLTAEQFTAIESEHRLLARSGEILEDLAYSIQALDSEQAGAERLIHQAADRLETHAELDKEIAAAVSLLRDAAIHCAEAQHSILDARSRLDLSPERLTDLERQLGAQHDLARKHRVEPDRLEEVLDRLKSRHDRAGSLEIRLQELDTRLEKALAGYRKAASKLSTCRQARAKALAESVMSLMQELGMEGGQFEFQVRHDETSAPSHRGSDRLELLVSANPGVPPGPIRKVASGGELSRISLAIKVASNSGSAVAQVFDEVDAGIGGDTAHSVGALLKSLSVGGQVLCVTHLAQVAVFADRQIQVLKSAHSREARVETSLLEHEDRIDEIARMLGGRLSDQSRAHAVELLDSALTRH